MPVASPEPSTAEAEPDSTGDGQETAPAENPFRMRVEARNYELLRRLDRNRDGTIEASEAREAMVKGGRTRILNEGRELRPTDRRMLVEDVIRDGGAVSLEYGDSGRKVGGGDGEIDWDAIREDIYQEAADDIAAPERVGQGRDGDVSNNDCGPSSALYMHHRRMGSDAPSRTHAEMDALIEAMSQSGGTTPPQMVGIMNENFRHAGGRYYTHEGHEVSPDNLATRIIEGLASDPGGVMVPIISTFNEADMSGTRHWITVTGFDGENVEYYDPGGPDGANNLRVMPFEELRASLPQNNAISPNEVVYGTSIPESDVVGELATGDRIGELEVRFGNRGLHVTSGHGVYGDRAEAQRVAQSVADDLGEDAIVRREGNGYAVYGVDEIRAKFGGLWSENTLSDLDSDLTDVYMTDPTSHDTRRARSGPQDD